ncbi:MAG: BlaI/MecI/CopY family transcriptional regulator [Oscillospiraceae bacterium]
METEKIDRLPDAELDVMLVLWNAHEPMKTSAILEVLNREKNWSMSTLQALLSRLSDRGFVRAETLSRLKYYSPAVREEEYRIKETKSFLKKLHGNSFKSLVLSLIDGDAIDGDDLEEIETMLREAGAKNGK